MESLGALILRRDGLLQFGQETVSGTEAIAWVSSNTEHCGQRNS